MTVANKLTQPIEHVQESSGNFKNVKKGHRQKAVREVETFAITEGVNSDMRRLSAIYSKVFEVAIQAISGGGTPLININYGKTMLAWTTYRKTTTRNDKSELQRRAQSCYDDRSPEKNQWRIQRTGHQDLKSA